MTADEIRRKLAARFPAVFRLQGQLYAVGGALRDLLLEAVPADLDLVCRGASDAAARLAAIVGTRVVTLGREPLLIYRVPAAATEYDIAEMTGGSIEEDLGRRDFTLDALALSLSSSEAVIDPFDGLGDIREKRLRMISMTNLEDDPLRVIRGVRLATRFQMEIEANTLAALRTVTPALLEVAPERVTAELDLLLQTKARGRGLRLLSSLGVDSILLDDGLTDDQHEAADRLEGDELSAYALLLVAWLPSRIDAFSQRWRWSDQSRTEVQKIVRLIRSIENRSPDLPIALFDAGKPATGRAIAVLKALGREKESDAVQKVVDQRGSGLFSMRPLLDGNAIGALTGLPPGPLLGRIRRRLLEAQLEGSIASEVEAERLVRSVFSELDVDVADRDGDIEQ